MNDFPRFPNYGSPDRFPPALAQNWYTYQENMYARFPPSDDHLDIFQKLKPEKQKKSCNICFKIWKIFCECCTGNNDEPF